jgi:hypothetical protein
MVGKRGPDTHHVVPHRGRTGWDVKRGGSDRASGHFDTKHQAVDFGRQLSRSQETELRIHNQDGRIAQSDSHGRDPNPPKG